MKEVAVVQPRTLLCAEFSSADQSPPQTFRFLQAGCPSCRPTNSKDVKCTILFTNLLTYLLFTILQLTLPPGIHPSAGDNAVRVSAAFQWSAETSDKFRQRMVPYQPSNCCFHHLHRHIVWNNCTELYFKYDAYLLSTTFCLVYPDYFLKIIPAFINSKKKTKF